MRVESGRRAVLRLEVEGRPAQTYSMPGSTTSRTARKIAGAAIQGWKRTRRMPGATGRPQAEQYRLSGLSRYRHDSGAEHGREVRERPLLYLVAGMPGRIESRDGRRRHHHPVVPVAQIGHGMQNADVRADAGHGHLLGPGSLEQLVQVGLKESGVAALADQGRVLEKGLELLHHIRLFGPADAMHREDLELSVVWIVGVGEKNQLVAGA